MSEFPGWVPPDGTTPRRGSGASGAFGARERSPSAAFFAALGSVAPLLYGQVQSEGQIGVSQMRTRSWDLAQRGTYWYVLVVWGEGPLPLPDKVLLRGGDEDRWVDSAYRVDYPGTMDQPVDPWLAALIDGYADTLAGVVNGREVALAYSVIEWRNRDSAPVAPTRQGQGLPVWDPRSEAWAPSTNPALIHLDVIRRYGREIDWDGSLDAIKWCGEELESGAPRWTAGIEIAEPMDFQSMMDFLRAYSHTLVVPGSDGWRLVADKPTAVSMALTDDDFGASDDGEDLLEIERVPAADRPTAVQVIYTEHEPLTGEDSDAWVEGYSTPAVHPHVALGLLPYRLKSERLPGIHSREEADRQAVYLLNAATLRDLRAGGPIWGKGLSILAGDVVSVTHRLGLTAKPMRVLDCRPSGQPGVWDIRLEEYDSGVYSDDIDIVPDTPDTRLPNPLDVPQVEGLDVTEELFRTALGTWGSRLRVSWELPDYVYTHEYELRLSRGSALTWRATTRELQALTPAVEVDVPLLVSVRILAANGREGAPAEQTVTVVGKDYPPGDVRNLRGIEVGGQVRLRWDNAADEDLAGTEVRYGPPGTDWAASPWRAEIGGPGTFLDRIAARRLESYDVPPGVWQFAAKHVDTAGNLSADAATVQIEVDSDADAYFVDAAELPIDAASSTRIFVEQLPGGGERAWSATGDATATVFPAAAGSYADPEAAYDVRNGSEWISQPWHVGDLAPGGTYSGRIDVDWGGLRGIGAGDAVAKWIETSPDGGAWTPHPGTTLRATAAYVRVRATAAAGSALYLPGAPRVRLDVETKEVSGSVVTSVAGPARIPLPADASRILYPTVLPIGANLEWHVEDVVVGAGSNYMDLYVFDKTTGAQVSRTAYWSARYI